MEEEAETLVNNRRMQRSNSAEGKRKNAGCAWSLHGCAFRVWSTEEGTKAERAGQNNGPSQMPRYVTGLFEFTIVKATIVGEGLSPHPCGGREAGSCAPTQVPREPALTLAERPAAATQDRAGLLLTARRCPVTVKQRLWMLATGKGNERSAHLSPSGSGPLE